MPALANGCSLPAEHFQLRKPYELPLCLWCRCPSHNCSNNGQCSSADGTCQCSANWTGIACNESVYWKDDSLTISPPLTSEDTTLVGISEIAGILKTTTRISENTAFKSEQSFFEMPEVSETRLFIATSMASSPSVGDCRPQTAHNCRNCGLVIFILCMVTTASVIIHIFICVRLKDSNEQKQNLLPKRRKLRKRNRSQFISSESSSDCSI